MKQSKKIFTRMLINNWGGISHKVLEFHEYVNLFSGKSGSGKSTVMDAIQVILYGSTNSNFLNKAADDAKNRRSVLSYLRGAQKDGSYKRIDEEQKQRAHSLQGLSNLLYQAGFDRVIVYGNGRMEAPRENEQRWHFAAIRRLDPDGASEGEKNI